MSDFTKLMATIIMWAGISTVSFYYSRSIDYTSAMNLQNFFISQAAVIGSGILATLALWFYRYSTSKETGEGGRE
jgi:hypothetical protein